MSTLTVKFDFSSKWTPDLRLRRCDVPGDPQVHLLVESATTVDDGRENGREVVYGLLDQAIGNIPTGRVTLHFVTKCSPANSDAIRAEVNWYRKQLKPLQGRVVPYCYGLFEGTSHDGVPMLCLLLKYTGEPAKQGLLSLNVEERCV